MPATPPGSGPAVVLPIFPLPDVTLFPHTFLPLHVFEARYRALVTDALARDRRLAVARLEPGYERHYEGRPAVRAIAGAGEIVNWERLPTGRYNLLVRGDQRVRIARELPADTLYRLVLAVPVPDDPPTGDVSRLVRRIRAACGRLLDALERPRDLLDTALGAGEPPAVIADRAASGFIPDPDLRQSLLETPSVQRRLERVCAALEALVDEVA
jgi:Lon protease-like protein